LIRLLQNRKNKSAASTENAGRLFQRLLHFLIHSGQICDVSITRTLTNALNLNPAPWKFQGFKPANSTTPHQWSFM